MVGARHDRGTGIGIRSSPHSSSTRSESNSLLDTSHKPSVPLGSGRAVRIAAALSLCRKPSLAPNTPHIAMDNPQQGSLSWRLSSHPITLLCFLGFRIGKTPSQQSSPALHQDCGKLMMYFPLPQPVSSSTSSASSSSKTTSSSSSSQSYFSQWTFTTSKTSPAGDWWASAGGMKSTYNQATAIGSLSRRIRKPDISMLRIRDSSGWHCIRNRSVGWLWVSLRFSDLSLFGSVWLVCWIPHI